MDYVYKILVQHFRRVYYYYYINLQFPSGLVVTSLLFSEADISSLEIAFLKAVMLPPEIARFSDAVFFNMFFNVNASLTISVNQPNQTRLWFVTIYLNSARKTKHFILFIPNCNKY